MPSGTGKTVSLLSLIVAYQQHMPEKRKLIYCSRTMSEIEKALVELQSLMKYRAEQLGYEEEFRGLGLTSRKNLCLHPSVKREKSGSIVDARCRSLTAGFVKEKKDRGENVDVCTYHDNLDLLEPHNLIPNGVWSFDALLKYGEEHKQCPYFTARRMMEYCNVVIFSYHYLLDPKIAERVSKDFSKDCIVVFDEAHNIDNVCIESLSTDITEDSIRKATRSAQHLERRIAEMRETDQEQLQNEYEKLVQGLREADESRQEDAFMANPALPDDLLKEAVPGNIRRAEHFVAFLKRFLEYLKTRMKVRQVISETPPSFLAHLKEHTFIEKKPLRFCAERLTSLVRTLELTNIEDYQALQEVATFATLVATYEKGFLLILEPYESDTAEVPNPTLHFTCLDAAIAIRPVLEFLRETYRIKENDFLSFDAMRHAAQCLGRVLRGKDDYGVMVLADRRFQKKRTQLPKWINQGLQDADTNLSTDMAVSSARRFLKTMAQPFRSKDQEGISTWGYEDLMQHQQKIEEERGEEPPPVISNTRPVHGSIAATYESDYEELDQEMMELEGF
ncbi:hypothetical protein TrVFT333_007047 [Trichoderma virens FT-333]|nr:hypothetical protein TrVFT333_007047 [Trichoderma virens FT-333]